MPSTLHVEYLAFAKHFVVAFAPEILTTYFRQVELYVSNQEWLSSKCQYQIFQFFTEWCVFSLLPLAAGSNSIFQCQAQIHLDSSQATL